VLSNEALLSDRQPSLLAWLIGPSGRVVFDESHLGVERPRGVASLLRHYRLSGLLVGLALVAALYGWRVSFPFAVPRPATTTAHPSIQRSSQEALVHILSRGLADRQLLPACVQAWKRSFASGKRELVTRIEEVATSAKSPVQGYRAIVRMLSTAKPVFEGKGGLHNDE
jgi:hypothetical protein